MFTSPVYCKVCPDGSVGIATRQGLDVTGIESRWRGEIFRIRPDWPCGPPSLLYKGYRVFDGGKAAWVVALATDPYVVSRLKKKYSYTSAPPLGLHGLF